MRGCAKHPVDDVRTFRVQVCVVFKRDSDAPVDLYVVGPVVVGRIEGDELGRTGF
jgi:hypothetical protein